MDGYSISKYSPIVVFLLVWSKITMSQVMHSPRGMILCSDEGCIASAIGNGSTRNPDLPMAIPQTIEVPEMGFVPQDPSNLPTILFGECGFL